MKLVNVTEIEPSTYNPRVADPARLDLIELSLRKLGFLLPLYATPDGEIISGHQRHHVACRMGAKQVPLEVTRSMDLAERKGVNVVFNRATNDLGQSDTVAKINEQLKATDVRKLAECIPDKEVNTPEFYPCLNAKMHPIAPFLKANQGRWKTYSLNIAKTLKRRGITMPIVATRDYRVVNGIGRLQHGAELGLAQVPVVFVTDEEGKLAEAMLNYLSMDFDIHRRYEDLLRHNSFRRLRQVRNSLGRGFIFAVAGDSTAKAFDMDNKANRDRWIKQHGRCVLDFGAGHLHETRILRKLGISVTPFEPYRVNDGDEIDKAESIKLKAKALAYYTTGWNFITPWEGLTVWAKDANALYTYDGTNWGVSVATPTSLQNLSMLGVNTTADSTNKLAVASEAILFNHIGGDLQIKLNKNAAGNKAGFLFQTNWSARAEFGLLGDDNFTLKVSPDGSTFYDSLKMLAGSGRAAVKANGSGLSAAGTTQGTATAITKQTNQFTTVAASSGAILPSPEQGEFIFVANAGANAMNVYPASGHSINALANNAAFSLAAGKNALFWAATSSKWYANLSA